MSLRNRLANEAASIHDRLADKAAARWKAASELSAVAQKHANATWFFLIVASIVWYFANWDWALIPATLGTYTALKHISLTLIASRLKQHETRYMSRL